MGKDFNNADKGKSFKKGGDTMASKMNPGFMAMMAKKKDGAKKMASGGMTSMGKVRTAAQIGRASCRERVSSPV